MKNIHIKQPNFQNNKRKLTELPITIVSGDEHKQGDNLEMTRQRIERAAMYLMSIFNLLKVVAMHFEGESESKEMSGAFEDFINHAAIGYGIADSILASASCLTEFIEGDSDAPKIETKPNTNDIALSISALLNNPDLPPPIKSGIDKVMTDFFNYHVDQSDFSDDTNSSEFITRLLASYEAKTKNAAN